MPEFHVRSDTVNVEQIMEQIRARIREKRGLDYTEAQIQELASIKLEKFLDPRRVRSDLLDQFRRAQVAQAPPAPPNYAFGDETLYTSHRGLLVRIRRWLQPLLKLFFNPNPLIQALHIQAQLNTLNAERESVRRGMDQLYYEVIHNLVLETTRSAIEVKNLKMRVESLTSRLEFNERRARALEGVVVYKPATETPAEPPAPVASEPAAAAAAAGPAPAEDGQPPAPEGPGQRSRRRRRRRGRRSTTPAAAIMGGAAPGDQPGDQMSGTDAGDADGEYDGDTEELQPERDAAVHASPADNDRAQDNAAAADFASPEPPSRPDDEP
jgi:hypothetical protein